MVVIMIQNQPTAPSGSPGSRWLWILIAWQTSHHEFSLQLCHVGAGIWLSNKLRFVHATASCTTDLVFHHFLCYTPVHIYHLQMGNFNQYVFTVIHSIPACVKSVQLFSDNIKFVVTYILNSVVRFSDHIRFLVRYYILISIVCFSDHIRCVVLVYVT